MDFSSKFRHFKYAVSDKFDDVKYFVGDKIQDVKYIADDKFGDVKDFVEDTSYKAVNTIKHKRIDVGYFVQEKVNINSKADIIEAASYVLFPAGIPLNIIMSSLGKDSASTIQSKNNHLRDLINMLESFQEEGNRLDQKINKQFAGINKVKGSIHNQLNLFAEVFEKIHNRPTYNLLLNGHTTSFQDLFQLSDSKADYAMFDSYLIRIYDDDAGIMGLLRSPAFAAILKFRENVLTTKIESAVQEVNECIDSMKVVNLYLRKLSQTAKNFEKELSVIDSELSELVSLLSKIVDSKINFEQFSEEEVTLLDTIIKMVQIAVMLVNTHLFEDAEPDKDNGLVPINKVGIAKVVEESALMRNAG